MTRTLRFRLPLAAAATVLLVFAPASARALHVSDQTAPGALRASGGGMSFSLGASVGVIEGTARELALYYPYGKQFKLSELTWDIKDVVTAGLNGSIGIGRRFRVNLGVWSALTEGSGMMIDRDWNYPDSVSFGLKPSENNWSDESRHPDTSVDKGLVVDQNLSVLALQSGGFSLRGIVGFKYDTWKWSSRGGTYVYSTKYYGSRDAVGSFPANQTVISYEQQYSIPYFGIGAGWSNSALQVATHLLYSPLVSANDSDSHLLRGVLFEGEFTGGTYVGLGLNATWAFASHWAASLGVEYQSIPEIVGDVTISGEEGYGYFPGGGGVAMNALSVALGTSFRF